MAQLVAGKRPVDGLQRSDNPAARPQLAVAAEATARSPELGSVAAEMLSLFRAELLRQLADDCVTRANDRLASFGTKADPLRELARYITSRKN